MILRLLLKYYLASFQKPELRDNSEKFGRNRILTFSNYVIFKISILFRIRKYTFPVYISILNNLIYSIGQKLSNMSFFYFPRVKKCLVSPRVISRTIVRIILYLHLSNRYYYIYILLNFDILVIVQLSYRFLKN